MDFRAWSGSFTKGGGHRTSRGSSSAVLSEGGMLVTMAFPCGTGVNLHGFGGYVTLRLVRLRLVVEGLANASFASLY